MRTTVPSYYDDIPPPAYSPKPGPARNGGQGTEATLISRHHHNLDRAGPLPTAARLPDPAIAALRRHQHLNDRIADATHTHKLLGREIADRRASLLRARDRELRRRTATPSEVRKGKEKWWRRIVAPDRWRFDRLGVTVERKREVWEWWEREGLRLEMEERRRAREIWRLRD